MNDVAGTPPNVTEVAPVKLEPFIVTVAPAAAEVGLTQRDIWEPTSIFKNRNFL